MTYIRFVPGKRNSEEENISIRKNILFFNASLIRNNNLDDKKGVEIFIDNSVNKIKIGFLFAKDNNLNSLKLTKPKKGDAKFSSAMGLFNELKRLDKNFIGGKFQPKKEKTEQGELFTIEIHK